MQVYYFAFIHLLVMVQVCHRQVRIAIFIHINHSHTLTIDVEFLHGDRTAMTDFNILKSNYANVIFILSQIIPCGCMQLGFV